MTKWKTVCSRLAHADPPVSCDEPKCWRMASYAFVSTAKDQIPRRTVRCHEHAVTVAEKTKARVPA